MKSLALPLVVAVALSTGTLDDKKPKISLKANPAMGMSPVRVVVTADLNGGPNDSEELYCPSIEWVWGDETRSSDSADCDPFVAGTSSIKRRFTADHTYRSAGEYQVQFHLKKKDKSVIAGNTMVRVRPGVGDSDGGR
ncbi:MAG TPA: hypothetical protein VGI12_20925 [Vicinamibacterales bacterium]|jgi:hypothetical protein